MFLNKCNFFGISRGAVINPCHLRTILSVNEEHRPSCLMHKGGNDLGSRGNVIDNVVIGLTALFTQIRVQFHILHIHAPKKEKKRLTLRVIMSVLY